MLNWIAPPDDTASPQRHRKQLTPTHRSLALRPLTGGLSCSGRGASLSSGQEVSADCGPGGDPSRQLSTRRTRPDLFHRTFLVRCVHTKYVGLKKLRIRCCLTHA